MLTHNKFGRWSNMFKAFEWFRATTPDSLIRRSTLIHSPPFIGLSRALGSLAFHLGRPNQPHLPEKLGEVHVQTCKSLAQQNLAWPVYSKRRKNTRSARVLALASTSKNRTMCGLFQTDFGMTCRCFQTNWWGRVCSPRATHIGQLYDLCATCQEWHVFEIRPSAQCIETSDVCKLSIYKSFQETTSIYILSDNIINKSCQDILINVDIFWYVHIYIYDYTSV